MEIPENIANEFCKKRVILTLGQLAEIVRQGTKDVLNELNIKYQDGWTFDKVVKDTLIEATRRNHLINEMSFDRKTYRQNAVNEMRQIVENWCLCYYCSMMDPYNQNYAHWKTELFAHLGNVKDTDIKKGGGDKFKVLAKTWIDEYDLNQSEKIERMIRGKFMTEGIGDKETISFVADAFAKEVNNLIMILSDDNEDAETYMVGRFPQF